METIVHFIWWQIQIFWFQKQFVEIKTYQLNILMNRKRIQISRSISSTSDTCFYVYNDWVVCDIQSSLTGLSKQNDLSKQGIRVWETLDPLENCALLSMSQKSNIWKIVWYWLVSDKRNQIKWCDLRRKIQFELIFLQVTYKQRVY